MLNNAVQISVEHGERECFFHVFGDNRKFYDLGAVGEYHPELSALLLRKRFDLESEQMRINSFLQGDK